MAENEVRVSVICLTYNQDKYIAKCVESLMMQETTFRYEIIIHDDCSTDETQRILKKFNNLYPDKISLILQKTNQYSTGVNILDDIVVPRTKGKYIAICEGDDYWSDRYKLQKQVEAMEKEPECWICAHSVVVVDESDSKKIGKIEPTDKICIFTPTDVIKGGGGFVGTNSLVIRREAFNCNYEFRRMYPLDYFLQIMGSLHGGMLYLPGEMSAYRSSSNGSWTCNMMKAKEKLCAHYDKVILSLEKLDDETGQMYHEVIKNSILGQKFEILKIKRQYKQILKKENKEMLEIISAKEKIKIIIKMVIPGIDNFIDKRRIKSVK